MLNAAMIGLGWWGKELVRSARGSALMRFTRGVTLEPDTVRDFAAEMNIAIGTSYEDVLADKSIDAVVLATPHTRHRAQVEAAAAAGKHVFCEKPFALTVEDAKAAIAACRKAGVALGVGHNRRLWPSMVKLKEVVSSAEFGTVMFAEGNYSHDILANTPLDNWRSAPQETKAGGMTGMGIHLLDGVQLPDRPDGAGQRALDQAHPAVRVGRHHAGDARVPQRRDRHDRDLAEDAGLRVAARGLRLRDVGGVALRNQGHDLPQRRQAGDVRRAADQPHRREPRFVRRRRARARPSSRSTMPGSFTRSRRWKRCSTPRNATARGATLHDVKVARGGAQQSTIDLCDDCCGYGFVATLSDAAET